MNGIWRLILVLATLGLGAVGVFIGLAGVIRGCDAGAAERMIEPLERRE